MQPINAKDLFSISKKGFHFMNTYVKLRLLLGIIFFFLGLLSLITIIIILYLDISGKSQNQFPILAFIFGEILLSIVSFIISCVYFWQAGKYYTKILK